jgi:hypothetical protein
MAFKSIQHPIIGFNRSTRRFADSYCKSVNESEARDSSGKWTTGGSSALAANATGRASLASSQTATGGVGSKADALKRKVKEHIHKPITADDHLKYAKQHQDIAEGHQEVANRTRTDNPAGKKMASDHEAASKAHYEAQSAHVAAARDVSAKEREEKPRDSKLDYHLRKQKEHGLASIQARKEGNDKLAKEHAAAARSHVLAIHDINRQGQ